MTSLPLLVLLLGNFATIGLLPLFFFRRDGRIGLRWLATAAPFFVAPVALLLGWLGHIEPISAGGDSIRVAAQVGAVLLCSASTGLIGLAVGANRLPLSLWHQDNDSPVELVTWGPYASVRHPFYTSFILALTAAAIAFPHALTIGCLAYGLVALSLTARREERRLSVSAFGAEYQRYMRVTGRFLPRLRA